MTQLPPPPVAPMPPVSSAPRRRFTRGFIAVAALALAAAAGGVIGWALHPSAPAASPATTVTAEPAPSAFTPDQARQRACDAYAAIGPEWGTAYKELLPALTRPGWQWSDADVQDATKRFRVVSNDVVVRISALVPPNTPADVRDPINAYTGAILTYGTDLGWQVQDVMNTHGRAVDVAGAAADKACGLATG